MSGLTKSKHSPPLNKHLCQAIAINYNHQGLSDWELGLRLMNIINTIRQEHQVPQPTSN